MLSIDPKHQSERDNYKLLIGTIIPRPIAFVTSMTKNGTINGAPFSYFNIVSSNRPLISLAIQRRHGEVKDTARNILDRGEFVVHIVDDEHVEKINTTAASLSPEESEIVAANLTLVESTDIAVPGIKESKVRFECKLERALELGNEAGTTVDLLIGEIVRFHIAEEIYEAGKINAERLKAVSRLAGSDYAHIGTIFSLERPR